MDASVAQAVDERLARLIDRMAPWTARPRYPNFSERDTDPETMFPLRSTRDCGVSSGRTIPRT